MSPDRKVKINGHLIEEYWWTGEWVVYIDHTKSDMTYEKAVEWAWAQQPTGVPDTNVGE